MGTTCIRAVIVLFAVLSVFSCSEVLKGALEKGRRYILGNEPTGYISDFCAQEGENNREALLTWTNPARSDFEGVRVLRRTDRFPASYDDTGASVLYDGTGCRYRDRGLSNNTTYYYAAFPKNGTVYSNEGFLGSYSVADTPRDILARSFFIIGGSGAFSNPEANLVADIDVFDPVKESFYSESPPLTLPNTRMFCAVVSLGGKIYIFGGKNSTPAVSDKVDILDLNVDPPVWSSGAVMASPRCALSAVAFNGKIFCLGGSTTTSAGGGLATNYVYDTASNTWLPYLTTTCANLPTARSAFSAVAFRGTLYYYGGVSTGGAILGSGEYRSLFLNQPSTNNLSGMWAYVGANYSFYHKELNDGREVAFFLTFGGTSQTPQTTLPAGGTYNFDTKSVYASLIPISTGVAPVGYQVYAPSSSTGIAAYANRSYSGCEYFGDYIYLFGGLGPTNGTNPPVSNLVERLDVKDGDLYNAKWTSVNTISLPMSARYAFGITKVNF
jgi:hypothetical protein